MRVASRSPRTPWTPSGLLLPSLSWGAAVHRRLANGCGVLLPPRSRHLGAKGDLTAGSSCASWASPKARAESISPGSCDLRGHPVSLRPLVIVSGNSRESLTGAGCCLHRNKVMWDKHTEIWGGCRPALCRPPSRGVCPFPDRGVRPESCSFTTDRSGHTDRCVGSGCWKGSGPPGAATGS